MTEPVVCERCGGNCGQGRTFCQKCVEEIAKLGDDAEVEDLVDALRQTMRCFRGLRKRYRRRCDALRDIRQRVADSLGDEE